MQLRQELIGLSKGRLIEVYRTLSGKVGDSARTKHAEYVDKVLAYPQDSIRNAINGTATEAAAPAFSQVVPLRREQPQVASDPVDVTEKVTEALSLPFPSLRQEIERLYRAEATPQVVEVVREVQVQVPVQVASTAPVFTAPEEEAIEPQVQPQIIGRKTAKEVFGVNLKNPDGTPLEVDIWNDGDTNAIDPHFRWDKEHLLAFLSAIKRQAPVWFAGKPGTGKTQFAVQVAARLGRHLERVNFDGSAEKYDLIGGERVKAASTVWRDGKVAKGLRRAGTIILLDEVSFGRPDHVASLHAVLERHGVLGINETGEVIRPAPGVTFAAADNTNGTGDRGAGFNGTREQNRAFLDRFAYLLEFDFLPEEDEAALVSERTGLPGEISSHLVRFVNVCRAGAESGDIEVAPTLRQLFAWGAALMDGISVRRAFELTVVNKATPENAEELQQLYKANIVEQGIANVFSGKPFAEVVTA